MLFTCIKSWFFRNHLANCHQISHWSFCWNVIDSLFKWSCSIDCQAHIFFFKTKNCSNDDIFISCDDRIGKMLYNICMSAVAMSLRWANRGLWASCSHYFRILCWKSLTSKQKIQFPWLTVWELQSLQPTGLNCLIIFSFFVEKHKLQFPQPMVLEVFVWFTVVELSPTLWCPRLKKDGHLGCGRGICHLFWWLFFQVNSPEWISCALHNF